MEKAESPDPPNLYYPVSISHQFMGPGPTYIAPSSTFLFSHHSSSASLIDFLPSRNVADRLLDQYWKSVHPIARLVHKPSFGRRYDIFWDDVRLGIEPAGSLQAVVFAAMFSAVVSMPEDAILMEFGVSKKDLVDNFQMGTETALGRANMIRTTKIETLQAFVMYMVGSFSILCHAFLDVLIVRVVKSTRQFNQSAKISATHFGLFRVVLILYRYHSVEVRFRAPIPPFVELQSVLRNAWVYIVMVRNMVLDRLKHMFGA